MRKGTQIWRIREWLMKGYYISNMTAFHNFNCTRLGRVIHDLRHKYGMNISDTVGKKGSHSIYYCTPAEIARLRGEE